jgi:3-deoxy-D-manno-octulosonate 8-phosphate phosphatase (KDO 8-P phosphatase)
MVKGPGREVLDGSVLRRRAAGLRLVISDVDGVLTDGGVYYSENGEELKRFSVRDGMGVERLRNHGIETALLTREPSGIVARRAEKLRIRLVYLGVPDKKVFLARILDDAQVTLDEIAYIGDDVNDMGVMETIATRGLIGAPADARPEIFAMAHHRAAVAGGHGAFREFAEWLLELRRAEQSTRPFEDSSYSVHELPSRVGTCATHREEGDS